MDDPSEVSKTSSSETTFGETAPESADGDEVHMNVAASTAALERVTGSLLEPNAGWAPSNKFVGKTYSCPVCSKVFKHNGDFKRHLLTHSLVKPFSCNECGKQFAQKGNLMIHIRTHTGEKPFTCKECGKKYVQKGHLNEHMRTHSGEKPFDCSVCRKKFSRKCDLCEHMRTHTGEKPYTCYLCRKPFAQKGNLTAHLRSHTGERPFACTTCGKKFGDKSNLKKHMQKCSFRSTYKCPFCNKQYSCLSVMKEHLEQQHENKPDNTGMTSEVQRQLIQRLRRKNNCRVSYECPVCKIKIRELLEVSNHLKQHAAESSKASESSSRHSLEPFESLTVNEFGPSLLLQMQLMEKLKQKSNADHTPYECLSCNKQFFDFVEWLDHSKQHETTTVSDREPSLFVSQIQLLEKLKKDSDICTPYECPTCKKQYHDFQDWREHLKQHEAKTADDSEPSSVLSQIQLLEKIRQFNNRCTPYECFSCREQFTDLEKWVDHVKQHQKKSVVENKPSKKHSQRQLLEKLKHNSGNQTLFECPACEEPFFDLLDLKVHLKQHETKAESDSSLSSYSVSETEEGSDVYGDCDEAFVERKAQTKEESHIKNEDIECDPL